MAVKINPRQAEALEAMIFDNSPYRRRGGRDSSGKTYWYPQTNMGGAGRRMVDGLESSGLLAQAERIGARDSDDRVYRPRAISVAGLLALQAYYQARKPSDEFRQHVLDKIAELLPAREKLEAEYKAQDQAREEARKASRDETLARARVSRLAKLREILDQHNLDGDSWADDALIAFANDIEGAQY